MTLYTNKSILFCHSAAVIDYFKGAGVLVYFKAYFKIIGCYTHRIIGKRAEIELVQRVARVGNKLAQENFFVRVDRVDHHVEQFFRLGLELFLCHIYASKNFITPSDPHRPACNSGPRYRF